MESLLAIETSGPACSVCLSVDGKRFSLAEHVGRGHNERLLPMLSEICAQAGVEPKSLGEILDGVAFGCGPGSFTGVRIAAAAAQAIALSGGVSVARVSSSAALALAARPDARCQPGVVTLIRSRADLYYVAEYRCEGSRLTTISSDRLLNRSPSAAWYRERAGWLAAGTLPPWWRGSKVLPCEPAAEQVLELGREMLEAGAGVDAALALPEYFDGDTPWRADG